ncbi:MAG TPA: hypothetical protein VG106_05025, partial [Vicinamibacterales bacterium]|nr:hypothetical protein [Vicinamibacterales bacterium]
MRDIGRRVSLDGLRHTDGKAIKEPVRISDGYLPAAFEGRAATWSRAAGRVPSLLWIDRRYAKALRLPSERGPAGARDFLISLGAEVAARLQPLRSTSFNRETVQHFRAESAPEHQARSADERGYIRFVRGDHQSMAVHAVVRDIARAAQTERCRRGRALVRSLHDSWERLYAEHASIRAYAADRTLISRGRIPATWIADAASVAWMDNELGQPCPPCELVVRTPEYLAAIGDEPAVFASVVDEKQAAWSAVEALGIAARPRAKHLVAQLVELQRRDLAKPSDSNFEHATFIYAALSSMCPQRGSV